MELGPLKVYRSCRGGAHRTRKIGKYFGQIEQQSMDSGGERVKINRLGDSLVVRRQWMASDDHEKVLCRPHTPPSPAQSISQAGRQLKCLRLEVVSLVGAMIPYKKHMDTRQPRTIEGRISARKGRRDDMA